MNISLKVVLIGLILLPVAGSAEWLFHDNGVDWDQVYALHQDDGFGVKFSPGETGVISKVKAFMGPHTPAVWDGFNVKLYGWNPGPGEPGGLIADDLGVLIGTGGAGWYELTFTPIDWTTTDPFVIALTNLFDEEHVDTIYKDSDDYTPGDLYWYLQNNTWDTYNPEKHLMVRVWFSGVPVESNSLGEIKAVFK